MAQLKSSITVVHDADPYAGLTLREIKHRKMKSALEDSFKHKYGMPTSKEKTGAALDKIVGQISQDSRLFKMVVNEANSRGMTISHRRTAVDVDEDPYGSRRMTAGNNRYSSIQNEKSGAPGRVGLPGS